MSKVVGCAALLLLAGCGSNKSGSDGGATDSGPLIITPDGGPAITFRGTMLDGVIFRPVDVASFSAAESDGGEIETVIVMQDVEGACNDLDTNAVTKNSNVLSFVFDGTSALTAGTYNVVGSTNPSVNVQFASFDSTCNSPTGESASSGTVTITKVDASGISGTFDLVFNSDMGSGSFDAPNCAGAAAEAMQLKADAGFTCN